MPKYESYHAKADAAKAVALAQTPSPFTIEVRFVGDTQVPADEHLADDRLARARGGTEPRVVGGNVAPAQQRLALALDDARDDLLDLRPPAPVK